MHIQRKAGVLMGKNILAAVLALISAMCFSQFDAVSGKGVLLNNAYLYASEKERQTMDENRLDALPGTCGNRRIDLRRGFLGEN